VPVVIVLANTSIDPDLVVSWSRGWCAST